MHDEALWELIVQELEHSMKNRGEGGRQETAYTKKPNRAPSSWWETSSVAWALTNLYDEEKCNTKSKQLHGVQQPVASVEWSGASIVTNWVENWVKLPEWKTLKTIGFEL